MKVMRRSVSTTTQGMVMPSRMPRAKPSRFLRSPTMDCRLPARWASSSRPGTVKERL